MSKWIVSESGVTLGELQKGVDLELVIKTLRKQLLKKKKKAIKPKVIKRSNYIGLEEVCESKDKRNIVFKFKNKSQFSYNLINKKTSKLSGKFFDIEVIDGQKISEDKNKFYSKCIELSKEKWIKTFFEIACHLSCNYDEKTPFLLKSKQLLDKVEILSKIEFFQNLSDFSVVDNLIYRRGFKTSLKDIGVDNWFLENSEKDSRLWNYLRDYIEAKEVGNIDQYRSFWNQYKIGNINRVLKDLKPLLEKGYELNKLVEYLCVSVIHQGLKPLIQDFGNEDPDLYDYQGYGGFDRNESGLNYSTTTIRVLKEYVGLQNDEEYEKYPKHLKTEIDLANFRKNVRDSNALVNSFAKILENLKKLEFESGKYCVIAPKNPKEVVSEGMCLNHCVGNYAQDVSIGKSKILFMRNKANIQMPFMTLQIYGNSKYTLNMARGRNNRFPNSEEENFLSEYRKYLKTLN